MSFPFYKQLNAMDCGPTCLRMVAKYYGRHFNTGGIRNMAGYTKEGVSLLGISQTAENIGFRTRAVQLTYKQLTEEAPLPCILHWNQNHFVVLTAYKGNNFFNKQAKLTIADPAKGIVTYTKDELIKYWISNKDNVNERLGTALLLEPTAQFYKQYNEKETKLHWGIVFQYLRNSKWQITQVFIALLIASLLQLIFPFLTQSMVDTGIQTHNLQFITIVLIAQLMLVFSQTFVDFIRSRLLLNISVVLNFSLL
ncbi:MAG: C39 family peptidase, partial [Chitinophagaceae bacterium]|nr:C39 family peptidase [Chitinophagaceae bacterium]